MEIAIKGLIGAVLTVLIALLSKTENYYLAGVLPLFPLFSLISLLNVYLAQGSEYAVLKTVTTTFLSFIPYAGYLIVVVVLSRRTSFYISVAAGVVVWFLLAVLVVSFAKR